MTSTTASAPYLLTELAGIRIAIPVDAVSEIVRSVALSTVPGVTSSVEGAFNLRGTIVPVVDLRARLRLPPCDNRPQDNLVVCRLPGRLVAIRVDSAEDVIAIEAGSVVTPSTVSQAFAQVDGLAGLAATPDGALVIFDPSTFLSESELMAVSLALSNNT